LPLPFKLPIDSKENHKNCCSSCQILRLKCTKFDFGWCSAPDPAGEFTALTQLDLRGLLLREGREGLGERRDDGSSGEGSGGEREEVTRHLNFGPPQP